MAWYRYSVGPGAPRPLLAIKLLHGVKFVSLLALPDSGADNSLLDAGYAVVLGLDPADAEVHNAKGAGGVDLPIMRWPRAVLELQVGRRRIPYRGFFADFPADGSGTNLLGRGDFFVHHLVTFWEEMGLMNIDTAPPLPRPRSRPRSRSRP